MRDVSTRARERGDARHGEEQPAQTWHIRRIGRIRPVL
jgi:hypothetical protein